MEEEQGRGTKREGGPASAEEQRAAKRRSRWGDDGGSVPSAALDAPPAAPPAIDHAAIAAAKASARAALERARASMSQPASAPKRPEAVHASLILDASGRLIDSTSGKVVTDSRGPTATAKANQAAHAARANPYLAHAAEREAILADARPSARDYRGKRGLHFYEKGEVSERAQELRAQAATDAVFARAADSAVAAPSHGVGGDGAAASSGAAGDGGSGAAPVGVHIPPAYLEAALAASSAQLPPLPRVEWWDALILRRGQPDALAAGSTAAARAAAAEGANGAGAATKPPIARYELGVDPEKVTFYVEHPPPVEPPAEPAPPPPQPLPLTAKERKKLRSQRRQAAERAKQDQIRAGLVAPPPPKVKLSNLMKALGEQAVANPTEVEARVRAQVAAREAAHEARNAGAKLSKEERRAKKLDKAKADVAAGVHVVVYRVSAVASRQQLHKIELNATQLHLTGVCLLVAEPQQAAVLAGSSAPQSLGSAGPLGSASSGACGSVIVVEGGAKAQRAYAKLMLRRIKWDDGFDEAEPRGLGAGLLAPRTRPECRLVWRGLVAKGYFKLFKVEQPRPADAARKFLADRGVVHYWDAAASFSAEGRGLADALEAEEEMLHEGKAQAETGAASGRGGLGLQSNGTAVPMRGVDDDDD